MKEKKDMILYGAFCIFFLFLIFHYWDLGISWLGVLFSVIQPLLLGCAAAYILNLIMNFYERSILKNWKRKASSKRGLAILFAIITFFAIFILVIGTILPELKSCMNILFSSIPTIWQQILDFINETPEIQELLPYVSNIQIDPQKLLSPLFSWITSGLGASIFGYISSAVSIIFNLFVMLVFAIYLLAGKEWLGKQFHRLLDTYLHRPVIKEKILYVLHTLDHSFHQFIVGQCTEAVILGTLCIIGMLILRLPYAVMIGVLIGATALIPIFGAYIGGIIGTIMIITVSPFKAVVFLIFLVILQQFENQLIYPKVVGTSIGLPGIFVFSAVMVGGGLFGVIGVLLGIPFTAALYQLLKQDLKQKEIERNNIPKENADT